MAHIEHEGKVYCDWRMTVEGCEEEEYFQKIYIYCLVASGIEAVGMFSCLLVRKLLLKETWRGFLRGESLFHLSTWFIYLSHFIQICCLIGGVRFPITGVLWSLLDVPKFLTEAAFVSMTTKALPDSITSQSSKWSMSFKTRSSLLSGYAVVTSFIHVALLSSAYLIMDTYPIQGRILEKVGMTVTCVNSMLLLVAHMLGPWPLKRRIQGLIRESLEYSTSEIDSSLLNLTNMKLTQVIFFAFMSNTLVATNLLLLAYCPFYFTNMTMSKTIFILTYPLYFSTPIFYPFVCLFFDIKKWLYTEKRHTNKGSKREDSGLGHSQVRSTFSGKEQVDTVISELNQSN